MNTQVALTDRGSQYPTSTRKSQLQTHAKGNTPPLTPSLHLQYPCHLPSSQHQFTQKAAANPQPVFRSHANVSQADGCEGDSKGMATFSFFGHSHGSSTTPMAMAMTIGSHSHPCMPHQTHSFPAIQFNIRSGWMRGYHPTGISDPEAPFDPAWTADGQVSSLQAYLFHCNIEANPSTAPESGTAYFAGCGCSFTHYIFTFRVN